MKNICTLLFLSVCVFVLAVSITMLSASNTVAAAMATADVAGGYAGTVLDKVSQVWQPHKITQNTSERKIRVRVHIDGNGFPEQCEIVTSSGLAAMDTGVCGAVQKAAPFGTPPYALPIAIYMTFWTGQGGTGQSNAGQSGLGQNLPPSPLPRASGMDLPPAQDMHLPQHTPPPPPIEQEYMPANPHANAPPPVSSAPPVSHMSSAALGQGNNTPQAMQVNYVNEVMQQISPLVVFPSNLPRGTYSVTIAVQVNEQGQLLSTTLRESCGNDQLDNAVVQAALKKGHVTPPPGGQTQHLRLTFVVQKP